MLPPRLPRAELQSASMLLGMETALEREAVAQRGKHLEYFTIAWNSLEGLVAVTAGALAGNISLVGFGIDSFNRGHIGYRASLAHGS